MTSIDPINVNTQGISGSYGFGNKPKAKSNEPEETESSKTIEQTPISADQILSFMAQSAISLTPGKTIDPSKYVNSASAQRIAAFVQGFEGKVTEGLKAFDEEFKGVDISDSAKMAIVLADINKQM